MKNTFTFPHDYGARNDTELQRLLFEYGPEAGWAYWVLIEMLYEQGGKIPKSSYNQVAYAAHVSADLIQNIVEGSTLFKIDKKFFWSDRVEFTLETREEKSSKSRTAAQAKWAKWRKDKELDENAQAEIVQKQCESSADAEQELCHNSNSNSNSNKNIESKDSCRQEDNPVILPFDEVPTEKNMTPEEMVAIWNTGCGELPKARPLTEKRKQSARVRIKEFGKTKFEQIETMKEITARLAQSDFANGNNNRRWRADFGWLINSPEHWVNVLEGRYDNRKPADIRDIKNVNDLWKE